MDTALPHKLLQHEHHLHGTGSPGPSPTGSPHPGGAPVIFTWPGEAKALPSGCGPHWRVRTGAGQLGPPETRACRGLQGPGFCFSLGKPLGAGTLSLAPPGHSLGGALAESRAGPGAFQATSR